MPYTLCMLLESRVSQLVHNQVAHYGSMTAEWTFDKRADAVIKRVAPFWRSFASAPPQHICTCSQLVPKQVVEGTEVRAADSGLVFLKRWASEQRTAGDLFLLLTGRQRVPIASNVAVGRAYLLADFLTFDLAKVSRTELSAAEVKLCRNLYQTVDANRDGVLEVCIQRRGVGGRC
jgi:hypothetical protein